MAAISQPWSSSTGGRADDDPAVAHHDERRGRLLG